jgi:hypothetical protein
VEAAKTAAVELEKAADSKKAAAKEKEVATREGAETKSTPPERDVGADVKEAAAATGPSATPVGAAPMKERRPKRAANPALSKERVMSHLGMTRGAGRDASTKAVVHATAAEEEVCRAVAHPMSCLTFAELHTMIGDLHKVSES